MIEVHRTSPPRIGAGVPASAASPTQQTKTGFAGPSDVAVAGVEVRVFCDVCGNLAVEPGPIPSTAPQRTLTPRPAADDLEQDQASLLCRSYSMLPRQKNGISDMKAAQKRLKDARSRHAKTREALARLHKEIAAAKARLRSEERRVGTEG